jgi:copper chaperone CopZ
MYIKMTTTEKITVANLKCHGCATTIKNKLSAIEGVSGVEVNNDEDLVTVEHEEKVSRAEITKKLFSLGYPEATEENGLLTQLKSYASCMVGRLSK